MDFYRYKIGATATGSSEGNWAAAVGVITQESDEMKAKIGQGIAVLARIWDASDESDYLLNDGSNITAVKYTVTAPDGNAVTGHDDVSAGASCVKTALVEPDDAWTFDDVGYTFELVPDISENPLFETTGRYSIQATISVDGGNPVTLWTYVDVS